MTLLDLPIPTKPAEFSPYGAPPGVAVDFEALRSHIYTDQAWYVERPVIKPRLLVVHTNGAEEEGSLQSAINWGNASKNNTKAHYALNAPQPTKLVPSDRRAIANSTPDELDHVAGDSSFWTLAVESADRGTNHGGGTDLGDFLYDHDELLARIIAYESIVHGFPIEVPTVWTGAGVVTHTSPWDGVYTIYKGKSCPGTTKKDRVLRGDILPRARQIADAWTGVAAPEPINPLEDPTMFMLWKHEDHPELFLVGPGGPVHVGRDYRDKVPHGLEVTVVPKDVQSDGLYLSYMHAATSTPAKVRIVT